MFKLFDLTKSILFEQQDDSKITVLRKAITERLPITISYKGPTEEVLSGQRFDIEPIVLGKNAKSGNLVIWAYVFKGVSKKGLPGWKMFRVDRIENVRINLGINPFKLTDLPGYQKGKAPNAMKSLSSVDIFSPYWFEEYKNRPQGPNQPPPPHPKKINKPINLPQTQNVVPGDSTEPVQSPDMDFTKYDIEAFNILKSKVKDVNGERTISTQDFENAVRDLYRKKEDDWKNYQRMMTGNVRPGEGTRKRFDNSSKEELGKILTKNNIKIMDNFQEPLAEIAKRFKTLINS